jgi:hypothetical protein
MTPLTVVRSDGAKKRMSPDPARAAFRTSVVVVAMGVMTTAALFTARAIMVGSAHWKEIVVAGLALLAVSALQRRRKKSRRVIETIIRRRHPIPLQLIG